MKSGDGQNTTLSRCSVNDGISGMIEENSLSSFRSKTASPIEDSRLTGVHFLVFQTRERMEACG